MRSWLVVIRKEAGMSQKSVAKGVGISAPAYSYIENGLRNPSVDTAKKIAKVLGFDWQHFYDETKNPA